MLTEKYDVLEHVGVFVGFGFFSFSPACAQENFMSVYQIL